MISAMVVKLLGLLVGYTMEHIVYQWLPDAVEFDPTLQLPQFVLENFTLKDCSQNYTTGM